MESPTGHKHYIDSLNRAISLRAPAERAIIHRETRAVATGLRDWIPSKKVEENLRRLEVDKVMSCVNWRMFSSSSDNIPRVSLLWRLGSRTTTTTSTLQAQEGQRGPRQGNDTPASSSNQQSDVKEKEANPGLVEVEQATEGKQVPEEDQPVSPTAVEVFEEKTEVKAGDSDEKDETFSLSEVLSVGCQSETEDEHQVDSGASHDPKERAKGVGPKGELTGGSTQSYGDAHKDQGGGYCRRQQG